MVFEKQDTPKAKWLALLDHAQGTIVIFKMHLKQKKKRQEINDKPGEGSATPITKV